jgi:hypothetical protein
MRTLTAATLAVLFCAWGAQAQTALKYVFAKGDLYRYADTMLVQTTREMMGQEMKMSQDIFAVTRFQVEGEAPGGGTNIIASTDTLLLKIKSPQMDTTLVPVEALHKRNRITVSSLGEITAREVVDSVKLPMMLRGSGLASREILRLPVFSGKPVNVGEKWTYAKVDSSSSEGGRSTMTTTLEYTLLGQEKYAGRSCAKISFAGKVTVSSKGTMGGGTEVFTEGGGTLSGVMYFDEKKGVFVGEEGTTDMELTAAVTGQQNMTIPITSVTKMKHVLLPE